MRKRKRRVVLIAVLFPLTLLGPIATLLMMFDMDSPNRRGVLLALSAGFLWGFPGILVKSIEGFSFLGLATLRMFLAFLMIAAGILIFKKGGELVASFRYWKFWILLGLLMSFRWAWGMAGFQYT